MKHQMLRFIDAFFAIKMDEAAKCYSITVHMHVLMADKIKNKKINKA